MLVTTIKQAAQGTILNFVVAGERRSGLAVLGSVLAQTAQAHCHLDLFADEAAVRREAYESYFGDPGGRDWFEPDAGNPYRYLTDQVFDNPCAGEQAVGVCLSYPVLRRWELYDLLEERYREGDFCVVHLLRNPVCCLVSLLQAGAGGVWRQGVNDQPAPAPAPVHLEVTLVLDFVRAYEATRVKVRNSCADVLEVHYRDLFCSFDRELQRVFEFLELSPQPIPRPAVRRLRNRDMRTRVSNFAALYRAAPREVRGYLDAEDFAW